jgi:hypothetical protein
VRSAPKRERGEEEDLAIISSKAYVPTYKFNSMNEFLTEESPVGIFNILDRYRAEVNSEILINADEDKKRITIEFKSTLLHLKFFKMSEDEEGRLKVKIVRKKGSVQDEFELTKEIMTYLDEIIIDNEDM